MDCVRSTGAVVAKTTQNPTSKKEFSKFQYQVKSPPDSRSSGKTINIGRLEECAEHVFDYKLSGCTAEFDGEERQVIESDTMRLFHLQELMNKLTPKAENIVWDNDTIMKEICEDKDVDKFFSVTYFKPYQDWLNNLLVETESSSTGES